VCLALGALFASTGMANLGSESETCGGSRVHLVGVFISFEENFYRLPFTPPPLSGSPYWSFSGVPYPKSDMPRVLLPGEPDSTSAQENQEALNAFWETI
jgi:hypothetical protein